MEEGQESKPVEQEIKPVEQSQQKPVEQEKQKEKPVHEKERKPGIFSRLANRLVNYRRVLEISTKPDKQEIISSIKVTLLGIALLGAVGFVIFNSSTR